MPNAPAKPQPDCKKHSQCQSIKPSEAVCNVQKGHHSTLAESHHLTLPDLPAAARSIDFLVVESLIIMSLSPSIGFQCSMPQSLAVAIGAALPCLRMAIRAADSMPICCPCALSPRPRCLPRVSRAWRRSRGSCAAIALCEKITQAPYYCGQMAAMRVKSAESEWFRVKLAAILSHPTRAPSLLAHRNPETAQAITPDGARRSVSVTLAAPLPCQG